MLNRVMEDAQESHSTIEDSVWLRGFIVAGVVSIWLSDLKRAAALFAEGEQLAKGLQDKHGHARILIYQGLLIRATRL